MESLPQDFGDHAYVAATTALDGNPRQIKRFVNSLLLLQRIVISRRLQFSLRPLAGIVGLQLAWPDAYRRFMRAAMRGQGAVTALTTDDMEPELHAFSEHFFTNIESPDLVQILLLAESITAAVDTGPQGLEDLTAATRERFVSEITNRGFSLGPRAKHIYYHPERPEFGRIQFTKNWINFQVKKGDEWTTVSYHALFTDIGAPLQYLESRLKATKSR